MTHEGFVGDNMHLHSTTGEAAAVLHKRCQALMEKRTKLEVEFQASVPGWRLSCFKYHLSHHSTIVIAMACKAHSVPVLFITSRLWRESLQLQELPWQCLWRKAVRARTQQTGFLTFERSTMKRYMGPLQLTLQVHHLPISMYDGLQMNEYFMIALLSLTCLNPCHNMTQGHVL